MGEKTAVGQGRGRRSAQGSVRDELAALTNFENLLRSPRIGPRMLEQIVAELRNSCEPVGAAFVGLVGEVAAHQPHAQVVHELGELAELNVRQLQAALTRAAHAEMGAKIRLELETEVHRVCTQLGAIHDLIELLEAAANSSTTELDLHELVRSALHALSPSGANADRTVRVDAKMPDAASTLMTAPRVMMSVIALALGVVGRSGCRGVQLVVANDLSTVASLSLHPISEPTGGLECVVPTILHPSLEVLRLVSQSLGAHVHLDAQAGSCEVGFAASLVPPSSRPANHLNRFGL